MLAANASGLNDTTIEASDPSLVVGWPLTLDWLWFGRSSFTVSSDSVASFSVDGWSDARAAFASYAVVYLTLESNALNVSQYEPTLAAVANIALGGDIHTRLTPVDDECMAVAAFRPVEEGAVDAELNLIPKPAPSISPSPSRTPLPSRMGGENGGDLNVASGATTISPLSLLPAAVVALTICLLG